jgi:hypothetical protein
LPEPEIAMPQPSAAYLAFALALAAQASAADPAADYARLAEALSGLTFATDPAPLVAAQTEMLARLPGRWTPVAALMADGTTFPDAALLARACDRSAFVAATDGPLSMTLTRDTGADVFAIRLRYAGGATWVASFDQSGYLAGLFGEKPLAEVPPDMLYSALTQGPWLGDLTLLPAGDDLILVQPRARPPELLVRCP